MQQKEPEGGSNGHALWRRGPLLTPAWATLNPGRATAKPSVLEGMAGCLIGLFWYPEID